MSMSWFWTSTVGIIITIGALVGAIVGTIQGLIYLRKWLSGRLKSMVGLRGIIEKQAVIESKIDKVLGELTHNGGSSTKDVVKAVSESMIRLESRQQAMLDSLQHENGMFECTLDGRFIWTNKKLCYMLGRTKDDLMGRNWLNSVSYDYREAVRDEFDDCLNESRDFHLEFQMTRSDYQNLKVMMKTTKMIDHRGNILGYFGTITDAENE